MPPQDAEVRSAVLAMFAHVERLEAAFVAEVKHASFFRDQLIALRPFRLVP
jgi:hypothetical protein